MDAIITSLLAPFLIHLVRAGQRASGEAGDALASAAGRLAQRAWARIKGNVDSRSAAVEAVNDVLAAPDDGLARGALQNQIRKMINDDPALRADLAALVEDGRRAGVIAGDGSVVISGSVTARHGFVGVTAGPNSVIAPDLSETYVDVDFDPYGFEHARGRARTVLLVGIFIGLVGAALFGYPIVRGFIAAADQSAAQDACHQRFSVTDPGLFDCLNNASSVSFEVVPWVPAGAILVLVSIALQVAGRAMSGSAEREYRRRERGP